MDASVKPRPRRVVYTSLFGYSERFNDFSYDRDGDIDFICFTDDPDLKSSFWTIRHVERGMLDPARACKRFKALPHRFLPEYDWSLYIDNVVRLKQQPRLIFDQYLSESPSPLVLYRHPERDCVYDEAEQVIRLNFDDPRRVRAQMQYYRHLGYPPHHGLVSTTFLLRRHNDPELIKLAEQWRQQVLTHSKRDQLSLNPVMWFAGFQPTYMSQRFGDFEVFDRPIVPGNVRVPRDFDDARYLKLNPDVTDDPRRHYLYHGAVEGRHYRDLTGYLCYVGGRLYFLRHRLKFWQRRRVA